MGAELDYGEIEEVLKKMKVKVDEIDFERFVGKIFYKIFFLIFANVKLQGV